MPPNTEITNSPRYEVPDRQGEGWYEFGEITFTVAGPYEYTVTESGGAESVTNDPEPVRTWTFVVTDDGTGQLKVSPTTDEAQITYTNVFNEAYADGSLNGMKRRVGYIMFSHRIFF